MVEYDPTIADYEGMAWRWSEMIADKLGRSSRQYRLAIWYLNDTQKEIAERVVKELLEQQQEEEESSGQHPSDSVVAEPVTRFYRAEEYHQHFLRSNACRMKCFF